VRAPAFAARTARLAALAAPLVRLAGRIGGGPSEDSRRRNRFAVVSEARGPGGARRATLTGSDVYGLTALLIVRGAEALRRGDARGAGALAPAEAFDARTFAGVLEPLLRVESVEAI
jgi:hypothetical protein